LVASLSNATKRPSPDMATAPELSSASTPAELALMRVRTPDCCAVATDAQSVNATTIGPVPRAIRAIIRSSVVVLVMRCPAGPVLFSGASIEVVEEQAARVVQAR
jgi:hypothetical protein